MTLAINQLYKRFGQVVALNGLVFDVPGGQVFGFLGANGAGKTTTMRIVLGVLEADAGVVTWRGADSRTLPRATWGYLPEERGLYPRMSVLDQLGYFASLYGVAPDRARREARHWLERFRVLDLADRRADELSKGNQQKIQLIASILHDPEVLLMDEPFTGLDPVNVAILREAFFELRDQGKTLIFSTHQMETVEALCESIAIVDRGKVVIGGPLREIRRSAGRRLVHLSVEGDHRLPWIAGVSGARILRAGFGRIEIELDEGVEPDAVLSAAIAHGATVTHFEVDEVSLEQIFIDHVGRPADEDEHLAPAVASSDEAARRHGACRGHEAGCRPRRACRMSANPRPDRHEPLMPNVGYIARREYAALVRGRLFFVSTLVLAGLAMFVAFLPVAAKVVDRDSETTVAIIASDRELGDRVETMIGQTAPGFAFVRDLSEQEAVAQVADRVHDAAVVAVRKPNGQLSFSFHLGETMGQTQVGNLSLGVFAATVLDFAAQNPVSGFVQPEIAVLRTVSGSGTPSETFDASVFASRLIVGAVFGFLIFITIVIYGMWVAQGVVAEKASRVMELLISAASTRQLVLGKTLGIGLAGATQTTIVLAPALLVLAAEDTIARLILGQGVGFASSLSALSPGLLLGFAVFYVLGFTLYALIYAAAGSLVSRPEDLQIIALPLSIVAIAGYGMGLLALTGGITGFIRLASYVPFWSPFVMLTRLSVGRVDPWELVLSITLLVVTILVTAVVAIRIYGAGVLLYGQRPGLRAYVAAARGR